MNFLSIPHDIIISALSFCSVRDVQNLDCSISNVVDRKNLSCCCELTCFAILEGTDSLQWVLNRKAKVYRLVVNGKFNGKYLSDLDFVNAISVFSDTLLTLTAINIPSTESSYVNSLQVQHLKNLQSMDLFYVWKLVEVLLSGVLFQCPKLKSINLKLFDEPMNWNLMARLWQIFPLLSSVRVRDTKKTKTVLSICRERKLFVIQCERVDEAQVFTILQACPDDSFHSIWLAGITFHITPPAVDVLVEKYPNLNCLKLDFSNHSYPIEIPLRDILDNVKSVRELSLVLNFNSNFNTLFIEKLPGNIEKLSIVYQFMEVETLIHLLKVNPSITHLNIHLAVEPVCHDALCGPIQEWCAEQGRKLILTTDFENFRDWEKSED